MASRFYADLEEYYLDSPTQGDLDRYEEARRPALADPLAKGTVLAWDGQNLYSGAPPPSDYPLYNTPEPSPNPPRPLLPSLLAGNSPSQGGTGWSLRLIEAVQQGEDEWAQIWRCEVVAPDTSASSATVVLKLRQESLFPPPDDFESGPDVDTWNWLPAKHVELREATAYTRFCPYQGRDIPLCYGFYIFTLPSNEIAVGVVLEDLVYSTIRLSTFFARETAGRRLTLNRGTAIALSTFHLQHRLQSCKMTHMGYCLSGLLAFRNSLDSPEPAIVAVGFGRSKPLEVRLQGRAMAVSLSEADREAARALTAEVDEEVLEAEEKRLTAGGGWHWRAQDQRSLEGEFSEAMEGVAPFSKWRELKELDFLV